MNKVIRLTSTTKDVDGKNLIVRVFVDSIGQYWKPVLDSKDYTIVRFKDGMQFSYVETPEEIDKMLGIEEPVK